MLVFRFLALLATLILFVTPVKATPDPDWLVLGGGYGNFDRQVINHYDAKTLHTNNPRAADVRLEYEWGLSLLPLLDDTFEGTERYFSIHPFIGGEASSQNLTYGLGGLNTDIYLGPHILITWSEGFGFLNSGHGLLLGSILEFRSMAEIGWQFDNNLRLTSFISHTSNGKITNRNPGSETAGVYIHVPVTFIKPQ